MGTNDNEEKPVSVINEVTAERERQATLGYDRQHDQQHDLSDLLGLLRFRLDVASHEDAEVPEARSNLIEVAALAVASVEWIDGPTEMGRYDESVRTALALWYANAGEVEEPLEQRHYDQAQDAIDACRDLGLRIVPVSASGEQS